RDGGLSEMDVVLCEYAEVMTARPWEMNAELAGRLKASGVTDRMMHDAMLIIGYFNFVNRTVLGLGVELEEHAGAGYNYD
ncbi:MAG: peroxidase, partial [Bacteroidota bacterium]